MEINSYIFLGICAAIAILTFILSDPVIIDLEQTQIDQLEVQKEDAVNIATTEQKNICNNKIYDLRNDYEERLDESYFAVSEISDRCTERYLIQRDFFEDVNTSLTEIKQLAMDINYNNLNDKLTDLNKLVSDLNCE